MGLSHLSRKNLTKSKPKVYIIVRRLFLEVFSMPIYEYQCENCGKHFEIFQKIADPPLMECRVCKGKLNKLISQCSFHLKGTGWYVTDYKKPIDAAGKKAIPSAESTETEKTEAKTETKTETKAEATTTTVKESKSTETSGGT
jgi:putative FmdB family regulatory protein